jgi:hypothetical protein
MDDTSPPLALWPGLTQVQLAELAGVHVNGIKRLERMEPPGWREPEDN